MRRWWKRALALLGVLVVAVVGALAWRLQSGPIPLPFLDHRIAAALAAMAPALAPVVSGTTLARAGGGVALQTVVQVRGLDGTMLFALPAVAVRPSLGALIRGRLVIARIDIADAALVLTRRTDGAWLLGVGDEATELSAAWGGVGGQTGLPRIHLLRTQLTIEDERAGGRLVVTDGDLLLSLGDGQLALTLEAGVELVSMVPTLPHRLRLPIKAEVSAPLSPAGELGDVALVVTGGAGELAPPGDDGPPFAIAALEARGTFYRAVETLRFARLAATVGKSRLDSKGSLLLGPAPLLAFDGTVDLLSLAHLTRHWPPALATAARTWLAKNLHVGVLRRCRVKLGLHGAVAEASPRASAATPTPGAAAVPAAPAAENAFDVACDFDGVTADYLPPLDPIRAASGSARITQEKLVVDVGAGEVGACRVESGALVMDLTVDPPRATITADVAGTTAAVLALVDQPPLHVVTPLGIAPAVFGGESRVQLELDLPIKSDLESGEIGVRASAALTQASLPNLMNGIGLADGTLAVRLDGATVTVEGTTILTGITAIPGPVQVTLQTTPGTARDERDTTLVVEGEGVEARATLRLVASTLEELTLDRLRLAGSDVTGRVRRRPAGDYDVTLAGERLDLEALLSEPLLEDTAGSRRGIGYTVAVDLASVRGVRGLELRGLHGSLAGTGGEIAALTLTGTVEPKGDFRAELEAGSGPRRVSVTSEHAGAVLVALGVEQIHGGSLALEAATDARGVAGFLEGTLVVRDFRIVRAPILAKILGIGSLGGFAALVQGEGMPMSEARFPFRWDGTTITLTEVRALGTIGLTADGVLDTKAGTVDFRGNVIPAYTLNTALGRIPVLGRFLVGGKGQGVFGIDYRVVGKSADPSVRVNPLTSVAPTVLRRWFVEPFQRR